MFSSFGNNSLDLEKLRELCRKEGEAVADYLSVQAWKAVLYCTILSDDRCDADIRLLPPIKSTSVHSSSVPSRLRMPPRLPYLHQNDIQI